MKRILSIVMVLALMFGISEYSNAAPAKGEKQLTGKIVAVEQLIGSAKMETSKADADKTADTGKPLGLLVGKGKAAKVYVVMNPDGTFGGKKVSKFAGEGDVNVSGKVQITNGINTIRFTNIEVKK